MDTPIDTRASRDIAFEREALVWLPQLAQFARALARNSVDAEDLVQETFLRAYSAWDQYEPGTECRAWLFTICRNIFLRASMRAKRVVAADDPETESVASALLYHRTVEGGLDDVFGRFDLRDALREAMRLLPEEYRLVFVLVDLQDVSYLETASTLGIPIGTVRSRLFRARRLLQEHLVKHAEDAGLMHSAERRQRAMDTSSRHMEGGA